MGLKSDRLGVQTLATLYTKLFDLSKASTKFYRSLFSHPLNEDETHFKELKDSLQQCI